MYFTDRGIEELVDRRGTEQLSVEWLAERLRAFVDLNPQFEDAIERLASFLARDDADDLDDSSMMAMGFAARRLSAVPAVTSGNR